MTTTNMNEALLEAPVPPLPDAEQVAAYLRAHPGFFEEHPELLMALSLPHAQRGTVSLVERQVALLRERLEREQRRLRELLENGRRNDRIQRLMHALTLDLMRAGTPGEALTALYENLTGPFQATAVSLRLHRMPEAALPGFVRPLDEADGHLAEVDRVLRRHRAWCGEVASGVRDRLFGMASAIRSAAILPVGSEAEYGLLAIGSDDPLAYNKAMDTHYLDHLAALLGACLSRWLEAPADEGV